MRPRHVVYDELLRHQVDLSFDLEQSFFRSAPAWQSAQTVLDFGAGNAYYSYKLSEAFPEKRFVCVERDPDLANIAKIRVRGRPIEIVVGSYTDLPKDAKFDFLIARHALSYVTDRQSFISWVNNSSAPKTGVLTIDANDSVFLVRPHLERLEAGNEKFKDGVRESGGNRDLANELQQSFERLGFMHAFTRQITVHSDIRDRKYLMYMFMKAVAEIDHGTPLPAEDRAEVDTWAADPHSYLQFGLFGMYFERNTSV